MFSLFSTRREIMIYAMEGNFKKVNGGILRERRFEFIEVQRGVNKSYGAFICFL